MIRRGWSHDSLMAMREADFGFWLDEQLAYDEAIAEARKQAAERR